MYLKRTRDRIYQGDIYSGFVYPISKIDGDGVSIERITEPYIVVLSQDCDLMWDAYFRVKVPPNHDKFIANIIVAPAYLAETFKSGDHLEALAQKMHVWSKEQWNILVKNKNERFHYLRQDSDSEIPDLVIDFKRFYAIPRQTVYNQNADNYLSSLDILYREDISRRFANYISRIGLPEEIIKT